MTKILLFFGLGLLFCFFEVFVPGGILAILGGILMLIAAYTAYTDYGIIAGILTTTSGIIAGITLIFAELYILRKSKLGENFFLDKEQSAQSNTAKAFDSFIGKTGVVLTPMNPSGKIEVQGKEIEAISESGMLEKGTPVKVLAADSFRAVVRKA